MANSKANSIIQTAAGFFVGIRRPIRLEAEVSVKHRRRFQQRYAKSTGSKPIPDCGGYYECGPGKWGIELRIYFNATEGIIELLHALGFKVEENRPYRPEYKYRINSNKLWWKLIEAGFRLGDNP
jgi:hypothetical protein